MALTGTKALQAWCANVTAGYPHVKVENMTKSWKDGLAFCAIIHHYKPELIDFSALSKKNVRENCTLAFEVAERELGIPALLDPEDMVTMASPDKLSILTYLSQYYNYFKDKKPGGPPPTMQTIPENDTKDVGVSEKGKEFRRRSLKKAKDKENKAAESGPLPAKISLKSDKCEICNKRVYLVERQVVDGRLFHRNCFRCTKCRSTLRPDSYKLTKDPRKFECMCHSDGDIWNLRMNISNRAGARLAGAEDGGTLWQSRTTPQATPNRTPNSTPLLPPKQSSPEKLAKQPGPVVEGSSEKPAVASAKPPFPGAVPMMHPHLMMSAARARFNPAGGSPMGSPQLQRQAVNGSATSLATQQDKAASQESLDQTPADSTARPVPLPRSGKGQENGTKPSEPSKDTDADKPAVDDSSEAPKDSAAAREAAMFSTDDESKTSSDVRSLQEGESLGFESSEADNIGDSNEPLFSDEVMSSSDEPAINVPVPAVRQVTIPEADETKEAEETTQEDEAKDLNENAEESKNDEDTLNKVNDVIGKEQGKTDVDIVATDVTNKSVEEGSSGDSALWDTKAELSDSFQEEPSEAKKPDEDVSNVQIDEISVVDNTNAKAVEDADENKSELKTETPGTITDGNTKVQDAPVTINGKETSPSKEDNYDDSLNPFGSEEELEEEKKEAVAAPANINKRQSLNPFESDEDEGEYDNSLNPFGDDEEEDEGHESHVSDGSVNPFTGSPIEETPLSLKLKNETRAASFSHSKRPERPPPPILSSGSYSVKTRSQILDELKRDRETLKKRSAPTPPGSSIKAPSRKSRRAPQPPQDSPAKAKDGDTPVKAPTPSPRVGAPADATEAGTKVNPVPSPRVKKAHKPERPKLAPPPRPPSMSKRRAPAPPAVKREVGKDHIDQSLIQNELIEIERRQRELEEVGVDLEKKLRQDTDDDAAHDDEMLTEWFDVVNKKNKLVRREGELIAQAQQQELELQHAEIEYELRVILQKQEHERIDADAQREEQLLEMLVDVVSRRNQIVERLEEDRLREEAEDRDIEALIRTSNPDKKKDGKEKKHKKKSKLGLIR